MNVRMFLLFVAVVFLAQHTPLYSNQELHSDDEIEALFDEEDDTFAEDAADTTVMQQEIIIKPISPVVLAARKVWDRMLIIYLWFQVRYAKIRVYLNSRWSSGVAAQGQRVGDTLKA